MASSVVKRRLSGSLETWRTRNVLRQTKMVVFEDLVGGRRIPDDLLFPSPLWVWREGHYVQEENSVGALSALKFVMPRFLPPLRSLRPCMFYGKIGTARDSKSAKKTFI